MAKKDNWVKLYRSLMNHEIWTEEPFTRGQAWVDLIMMATFKETDNVYRGNLMKLSAGSIRTSISYLARRWHRSENWVRKTLHILQGMQMVYTVGTARGTLITLENYASFQGRARTEGSTEGSAEGSAEGRHNKNVIRMYKENARANEDQNGEALVAAQEEERFIKVTGDDGRTYVYDTKEERYIDY